VAFKIYILFLYWLFRQSSIEFSFGPLVINHNMKRIIGLL